MNLWHIYIAECADKTLYTGITNNLSRRLEAHNSSDKGAKYTRGRRPIMLLYSRQLPDKSTALKEEHRLKKLSKKEKLEWIQKEQKVKSNLYFHKLRIDTQEEFFVYMRSDCDVCISEGFQALTRVQVSTQNKTIVASLAVVHSDILVPGQVSLSESAQNELGVSEGDPLIISHLSPIDSFGLVRAKIFGEKLTLDHYNAIMSDIIESNYSNVQISAFICACSGNQMSVKEVEYLTKAMVQSGKQLTWNQKIIADKHCIGGLPGNRTTPIIVAIAAVAGLTIPKTSSRAITSPSGTADTLEVFTKVNLSLSKLKKVVNTEGGCLAWGGVLQLSPVDDILIKVERLLDLDGENQLIASILSKKSAAGSTHIIIDIPVGPTAKVRTKEAAKSLKKKIETVATALGLHIQVFLTDGSQPIGRGIGPILEALDIVSVFENNPTAPKDLREKALFLSGALLEMTGKAPLHQGKKMAQRILESGAAWEKFMAICKAQGQFKLPTHKAPFNHPVYAKKSGVITQIDNRKLAKLAKLTGAPTHPHAGIWFDAPIGKHIQTGDLLMTLYTENQGELNYALRYLTEIDIIEIN